MVAAPALRRYRDGGLPTRLPGTADFTSGVDGPAAAYAAALLAVRTLADLGGEADLVRVYTEVARPTPGGSSGALTDADARLDDALETVLSSSRPALVDRWRARISELLR